MAVKIRLRRMGRKKRPFYRIVVVDSRRPRDGEYIESLGYYNPLTNPAEIRIDEGKALSWLDKGAIPSETALSLLRKAGILKKRHEMQKRATLIKSLSAEEESARTSEEPVEKETTKSEVPSEETEETEEQ